MLELTQRNKPAVEKAGIVPIDQIFPDTGLPSIDPSGSASFEQLGMARRLAVPGEDFDTSYIDQLYVEAQDAYIGGEDIWVGRQLSRFNDQVVVDCGAGPRGYGYILAERFGAKAYIAVEPHHSEALGNDVLRIQSSGWDRTIPVAIVPSDMRAALSRIPSDSSSILLFGIDFSVVGSEDYFADCSEKIGHVLHPNGVLAIGGSDLDPPDVLSKIPDPEVTDIGFKRRAFFAKTDNNEEHNQKGEKSQ